jgi:NADH dehydrogenase (ubiquinone) 1 alpha subcomplex subunit 13
MGVSWAGIYYEMSLRRKYRLEMTDARIALYPLLIAEEHRMYLRQLRKNRDYENELMKNVPGWETGTLYGEPVYSDVNSSFPHIAPEAYYAHARHRDFYDRIHERRKH